MIVVLLLGSACCTGADLGFKVVNVFGAPTDHVLQELRSVSDNGDFKV